MGKRVIPLRDKTGSFLGWLIGCPGCHLAHFLDNKRWALTGSLELPSFRPAVMINRDGGRRQPRCHSFISNGRIRFFEDSSHELAGLTVDLPTFDGER